MSVGGGEGKMSQYECMRTKWFGWRRESIVKKKKVRNTCTLHVGSGCSDRQQRWGGKCWKTSSLSCLTDQKGVRENEKHQFSWLCKILVFPFTFRQLNSEFTLSVDRENCSIRTVHPPRDVLLHSENAVFLPRFADIALWMAIETNGDSCFA